MEPWTRRAGRERVADVGSWLKRDRCLAQRCSGERDGGVARARVVATLGGGLERTLAALEPYLMQIRLERRASDA